MKRITAEMLVSKAKENGKMIVAHCEVNELLHGGYIHDGKYAWMVKIGEKGQFVIPKEARDLFDLQPGNEILVLGDENRGLAILPKEMQKEYIARIFSEIEE